jgi:hypothetical protein
MNSAVYDLCMKKAAILIGGSLCALLMMATCYVISEHPTVVTLSAGPSFTMTGNGQLASFTVYAPHPGNRIAFPQKNDSTAVWEIVATKGYFKGSTVGGLVIQYGRVPPGYSQLVPSESQVAPKLPTGIVYSFSAETTNAPGAGGYFYMDEKGPTLTFVPDLCLTMKDGREVRVKCGFVGDRTYREPMNLAEEVRKYQLRDTSESQKLMEAQCQTGDDSK